MTFVITTGPHFPTYSRIGYFDGCTCDAGWSFQLAFRRICSTILRTHWPHYWLTYWRAFATSYTVFINSAFFAQRTTDARARIHSFKYQKKNISNVFPQLVKKKKQNTFKHSSKKIPTKAKIHLNSHVWKVFSFFNSKKIEFHLKEFQLSKQKEISERESNLSYIFLCK